MIPSSNNIGAEYKNDCITSSVTGRTDYRTSSIISSISWTVSNDPFTQRNIGLGDIEGCARCEYTLICEVGSIFSFKGFRDFRVPEEIFASSWVKVQVCPNTSVIDFFGMHTD